MKPFALLFVLVGVLVTAGFVAALRLVLALTDGIPFYAGLASLAAVSVVVVAAGAWRNRHLRSADDRARALERLVAATACAFAFNLAFFVVVPVTLDRSVTTFLLSRLPPADATTGWDEAAIRRVLVEEYVDGFDAIGRRLEEQRASGNVREVAPGAYARTERAEAFLAFGRVVVAIYGLDARFVGE